MNISEVDFFRRVYISNERVASVRIAETAILIFLYLPIRMMHPDRPNNPPSSQCRGYSKRYSFSLIRVPANRFSKENVRRSCYG